MAAAPPCCHYGRDIWTQSHGCQRRLWQALVTRCDLLNRLALCDLVFHLLQTFQAQTLCPPLRCFAGSHVHLFLTLAYPPDQSNVHGYV